MPQLELASHHITQISKLYPDLTDKNIEKLKGKLEDQKYLEIINLLLKLSQNNLEEEEHTLFQIINEIINTKTVNTPSAKKLKLPPIQFDILPQETDQDDDDTELLPNQILARAKEINFEHQKLLEQILQEKKGDHAFFWQLFITTEYPDFVFIEKLNKLIGARQIEIPKENINPTQEATYSTAIQKKSSEQTTTESKASAENEPVKVSHKRKLCL